jgi:lipopolysaccharide export system permease protein
VRFAENTIPVRLPPLSSGALDLAGVPTAVLAGSTDPLQRAEFHWRLAIPMMGIVMALIGVPLARLKPRQGRYARVAFAILVFYVYIQLAIAGRFWLERGLTPGWLGLWWVHASVGLFGAVLIYAPRWLARNRYRRNMRGMVAPEVVPA